MHYLILVSYPVPGLGYNQCQVLIVGPRDMKDWGRRVKENPRITINILASNKRLPYIENVLLRLRAALTPRPEIGEP